MKLFLLLLLFFICNSVSAQYSDSLILVKDGINVTASDNECDMNRGLKEDRVLLTFENQNSYSVTITWDTKMWYDGECLTCNDQLGEYNYTLSLGPNESKSGSCALGESKRLQLFLRFNDERTDNDTELTKFELANFVVNIDQ